MAEHKQTTTHQLMKSVIQFGRADWQNRTVALGYKPSEITMLICIMNNVTSDHPGMKVSDISSILHVTSPTVTQLINRLETNELVKRTMDQKDRRAVRVNLTDKGEKTALKAKDVFAAYFTGLVEYLGEEQSIQLAELLSKATVYLKEKRTNGVDGS